MVYTETDRNGEEISFEFEHRKDYKVKEIVHITVNDTTVEMPLNSLERIVGLLKEDARTKK